MNIIIPMSGEGKRFLNAGYQTIKPLIEVHGKPIIEWVLKMFSPEDTIIFICRHDHISRFNLDRILPSLHDKVQIKAIDSHKKGPVYAVSQIVDDLDDSVPSIVSYCDYYMHWDYGKFRDHVSETDCDGSIVCYTGFHPHLLSSKNVYASCLVDHNKHLIQIKEKYSYEKDKMKAHHSVGLYYFKKIAYIKRYFAQLMADTQTINGEYYASLPFNYMVKDNLSVTIYDDIDYFCQWGTPEDLQDYLFWANAIKDFNHHGN